MSLFWCDSLWEGGCKSSHGRGQSPHDERQNLPINPSGSPDRKRHNKEPEREREREREERASISPRPGWEEVPEEGQEEVPEEVGEGSSFAHLFLTSFHPGCGFILPDSPMLL